MKMRNIRIAAALAGGFFVSGLAFAESNLPAGLAGYTGTGDMKTCLSTTHISQTSVIDDSHILFEVRGRKLYVNRLLHKCHGLARSGGFGYEVPTSDLCSGQMIWVLEQTGAGSSCVLGKFERVEERD